ncbi:hypothetical protein PMAYCL1PPCAC_32354 [Pristionchus mayeri]|uniref:Importin N-terminal domain-containing protein n=1 Tax=Pristionchus mayeri TaxID=1317129 RepID=A0AAN5IEY1_9BILA|nr:hypothetical protein PMAYCL1PPCAC_32354 [Pristionchus mayeri]
MTQFAYIEEAKAQFSEEGKKFDVQLLDRVISAMNVGMGDEQRQANLLLMEVKENPHSWTKVDAILEYSAQAESKYFALQILEGTIQTRWKSLPSEQRNGIKSFIVNLILRLSESSAAAASNALLLHKLNLVLVQIVKQDWPKNWPNFITDIVNASKTSDSICVNNMNILRLLSEEVFEFGSQNMTQAKEHHLKEQFCGQFKQVFDLCLAIFEKSYDTAMVEATLRTLHRFLSWIPVGYVFETNITELLANNFLPLEVFRSISLQCMTEIAQINVNKKDVAYKQKLLQMFYATMTEVIRLLGDVSDLNAAYKSSSDADQKFIANLAQFLVSFFKEHADIFEAGRGGKAEFFTMALELLLQITEVEETEIFKVCLDYWRWLVAELFFGTPYPIDEFILSDSCHRRVGFSPPKITPEERRRRLYEFLCLPRLREIMLCRMAKPEEVLVVENDQGEVIREVFKDTDSIALYKNMKETLVYLTHLDPRDMEKKMTEKLATQVTGGDFSWKNLNTLCWAIGAISGAMLEDDEKRFIVLVIRDLLGLVEQKRGKDNKAVIASDIMYIVGQYPRFLCAHWKFCKTVVTKLFEFMHETHEGVQDMACDTFIKIAIRCKRLFVTQQQDENHPFIDEMLANLSTTVCDLSPPQVHVFYEAVGTIISAQTEGNVQLLLLEKLMEAPNVVWNEIIGKAETSIEALQDPEVLRQLLNILKTNVAVCKAIGMQFAYQLAHIYDALLSVYRIHSQEVSDAVKERGEDVLTNPIIRQMRSVKREILVLLSTWVANADDDESVMNSFIPQLFDAILFDYQRNVAAAREPKVLSLLSIIITKFREKISPEVPRILDAVFDCTLEMINKDMEAFPEHRTGFFRLLLSLSQSCFPVFLALPEETMQFVIDAVVWAFQHSMRNVAEMGLDILSDMLTKVAKLPSEQSQTFYKKYYVPLLQHVLAVVADSNQVQVAGLTHFAEIMCLMFRALESSIVVPLNQANPAQSNVDFIFDHIGSIFLQHFTNLTTDQVRVIIKGFVSFNNDNVAMKNHIRDFIVQLKEQSGEDTSDLFLEEREKEIQEAQNKKMAVPGMANPNDIPDEEDMH